MSKLSKKRRKEMREDAWEYPKIDSHEVLELLNTCDALEAENKKLKAKIKDLKKEGCTCDAMLGWTCEIHQSFE